MWVWFFDFLIKIHYQYQKKVNVKISVILLSLSDFISKHQHTLQSGKLGRELLKTVNDLRAMLLLPVRTIATMKRKRVTKSITITRATCAWMSFKHCKNGHGHGHGQLNTPNLPNKNCVICNTDIGGSDTLDVFRLQSDCCDCIKGLSEKAKSGYGHVLAHHCARSSCQSLQG